MSVRYVFKVGPANRNRDYAQQVTVLADNYNEARNKAIAFRGYTPRDSSTWFISADEIDPDTAILERLAELIRKET
jgi:hypothetical protein